MDQEITRLVLLVAVGWAITFGLRSLPFVLFSGRRQTLPWWVGRLGVIISPIIIALLIVYSYSGLAWKTAWPYLAGTLTVGLQLVWRNGLVSIIAGTALYMVLLAFCAGCASERTVVDLDAGGAEVRMTSSGVFVGNDRVEMHEVPAALKAAGIGRERTIHVQVDESLSDAAQAKTMMTVLRLGGYSRSVLVTDNRAKSQNLMISMGKDGFSIGQEKVKTEQEAFNTIRRVGIPTEKNLNILVGGEVTDKNPAYRLRMRLKNAGYRAVDVVEAEYDNQFVFYVTKKGVRYGILTWVDPENVVAALKTDGAEPTSLIRLCGQAADFKSKEVMQIMLYLEDILRKAGYTNVKRFWLEGENHGGRR